MPTHEIDHEWAFFTLGAAKIATSFCKSVQPTQLTGYLPWLDKKVQRLYHNFVKRFNEYS